MEERNAGERYRYIQGPLYVQRKRKAGMVQKTVVGRNATDDKEGGGESSQIESEKKKKLDREGGGGTTRM